MQLQIVLTDAQGLQEQHTHEVTQVNRSMRVKVLQGQKVSLQLDGQPLTGKEWVKGKWPTLKKVGNTLVVDVEDQPLIELIDFFESKKTSLSGAYWTFAEDQGLVQTGQSVVALSSSSDFSVISTLFSESNTALLGIISGLSMMGLHGDSNQSSPERIVEPNTGSSNAPSGLAPLDTDITGAPVGTHTVVIKDGNGIASARITNDSLVKIILTLGSRLSLAADETLQVSADGGVTWIATRGSGTAWETADNAVTLQSGSGQHITARIADTVGNTQNISLSNNDYTLNVIIKAPVDLDAVDTSITGVPSGIHIVVLSDDSGTVGDRITNDSSVKVSLTLGSSLSLAADETLQVSADGGATWATTTGSGMAWETTDNAVTLQSGTGQYITARIVDTAGNTQVISLSNNDYQLDTSITAAPSGTHTVSLSDDSGTAGDRLTNDSLVKASLTLGSSLNLAADETLQVSADDGSTWVIATGSGTAWETAANAVTLLSGAGQHIIARIVDTVGNTQTISLTSSDYELDASISSAPSGIHTVTLSDDSGTAGDRITNDSSVKVNLSLASSLSLAADEALQVSADGGMTWIATTGSGTAWETADNAVTLQSGSGQHITARIVDTVGNTQAISLSNNDYELNTAALTLNATTPADDATGIGPGGNLTLTFNKNISIGVGNILINNLTDGTTTIIDVTDTSQVSINDAILTINPATDLLSLKDYSIQIESGAIKDNAGNLFAGITDNTTLNFTISTYTAGQATISLGSYGQLIAPVEIEGKWYYFWDKSGDGVADSSDADTMDWLEGTFFGSSAGAVITEDNRTFTIEGVSVILPTVGLSAAYDPAKAWNQGTSWSKNTAGYNTDPKSNSAYDDLLVIWDAFNGEGSDLYSDGTPENWDKNTVFWSATATNIFVDHINVGLVNGAATFGYSDQFKAYFAIQVL